jgi:hypothetical protein
MADDAFFIAAGLPPAKSNGQSATGDASLFISAGLPPEVESGVGVIEGDIDQTLPQWSA